MFLSTSFSLINAYCTVYNALHKPATHKGGVEQLRNRKCVVKLFTPSLHPPSAASEKKCERRTSKWEDELAPYASHVFKFLCLAVYLNTVDGPLLSGHGGTAQLFWFFLFSSALFSSVSMQSSSSNSSSDAHERNWSAKGSCHVSLPQHFLPFI